MSTTKQVQEFYTQNPYPAYGHAVKIKRSEVYRKYCQQPGRYLEAGCGTGHGVAGVALLLPHIEFFGVDFSQESLKIAQEVARHHQVKVMFLESNLMESLPFDFQFNYISSLGVLHHLESPEKGLRNLVAHLTDDGLMFIHVYGEDYHRRRFQIKEMLDLILPHGSNPQKRYEFYLAYRKHEKRVLNSGNILRRISRLSLRDIARFVRKKIAARAGRQKLFTDPEALQAWDGDYYSHQVTERWLDQFAHPKERTYNVWELEQLLASAGLEIVEMFSLGSYRPEFIPPEWKDHYEQLNPVEQYRLMELLHPKPTSPFLVARKRKT